MTALELAKLGKEMRDAQRRYFKNTDPEMRQALVIASKSLESQFDRAVQDILHPVQNLFTEGQP